MTVKAKAIVSAFYGSAPAHSYFNGCSTGGRQALTEAARFPDDFDGIVAGAAANPKTRLDTWRIWMGLETLTCGGGEGRNTFDNDGAARAVGREGKGAGARRRLAPHERQDRSDTTAVPVPAGSALYGERQHRRRGELHLPFTMTVAVSPLISINVPKGLDASARR